MSRHSWIIFIFLPLLFSSVSTGDTNILISGTEKG
jgi:hypothetical protein